jgi:hypothetical protein
VLVCGNILGHNVDNKAPTQKENNNGMHATIHDPQKNSMLDQHDTPSGFVAQICIGRFVLYDM